MCHVRPDPVNANIEIINTMAFPGLADQRIWFSGDAPGVLKPRAEQAGFVFHSLVSGLTTYSGQATFF